MGIQWLDGSDGDAIAVDDTFFPILVSTFFGAPTEPVIEAYFAWLNRVLVRAVDERVPMVNVIDSGPAGVPSARVRRIIAELSTTWGDAHKKANIAVTAWVVVDNSAIRSVLRVLEWLHGNMNAAHVASIETALAGALSDLANANVSAPAGLVPSAWQRPSRRAQKLG